MEALPWFWIWVVLAAALCIGEMLTVSFFMLPFAVGAGCAAITNALGGDQLLQFAIFIAVSILALIACRPLSKRISKNAENTTAGVDRLIGEQGTVVEGSGKAGWFKVMVARDTWNAITEDGSLPDVDTSVEVLRVDGAHLVVRKAIYKPTEQNLPLSG